MGLTPLYEHCETLARRVAEMSGTIRGCFLDPVEMSVTQIRLDMDEKMTVLLAEAVEMFVLNILDSGMEEAEEKLRMGENWEAD